MTIEPFPHSSTLSMASVHPCKHASVMKRVVERMDGKVREEQRKAAEAGGLGKVEGKEKEKEKEKEKKGKWGLPSLGAGKKEKEKVEEAASSAEGEGVPDQPEGLRVDQYLVVFLKFMSSIGESSLRLASLTPSMPSNGNADLNLPPNAVPTIEVDATNSI